MHLYVEFIVFRDLSDNELELLPPSLFYDLENLLHMYVIYVIATGFCETHLLHLN